MYILFFFSSRRRHTRYWRDWSSDVCSSDLAVAVGSQGGLTDEQGDLSEMKRVLLVDSASAAGGGAFGVSSVDRKSVVEGKSVDLGGRRIIKKKKTHT